MFSRTFLLFLAANALGATLAADVASPMPAMPVAGEQDALLLTGAVAQRLAEAAAAPAPAPAAAALDEPVAPVPVLAPPDETVADVPVLAPPVELLAAAAPAPAPGVMALGGKKTVYAAPILAAAPISGARPLPPLSFPKKAIVVEPKILTIPKIKLVKSAPVPISGARPLAAPQVVRIAPKQLPDKVVPNYLKPGLFAPEVVIGKRVKPAVPLVTLPEITTFTLLRPISGAPISGAPISGAPISGGPRKMLKKKGKKPVSGVGPYAEYEQVLGVGPYAEYEQVLG